MQNSTELLRPIADQLEFYARRIRELEDHNRRLRLENAVLRDKLSQRDHEANVDNSQYLQ